jgi:hypothetical protein
MNKVLVILLGCLFLLGITSCKKKETVLEGSGLTSPEETQDSGLGGDTPPVAVAISPANFNEDTESVMTLVYSDIDSDLASTCSVSRLNSVTVTTACSCSAGGICTVGVTGTLNYNGAGSFDYTVTANSVASNTVTSAFTIDSVSISCPTGFVAIEGNGILGTVDFCIMKYEAKANRDGDVVSTAEGLPWVSIPADDGVAGNDTDAFEKCENMTEAGFSGSFGLVSNPEWMTIARDIENTSRNWSGGIVGSGHIPRGHSDNSPANALAVRDINDPYHGTNNSSAQNPGTGWEQKRVHSLSNGSEIWDFSGNVWEFTDWDSRSAGFTLGPIDEEARWKEFRQAQIGSLLNDDFLPDGAYTSNNSFGQWYGGTGGTPIRGGAWAYEVGAGVFSLSLASITTFASPVVGFRCSYRL